MDAELTTLTGAAALVQEMVGDGWAALRDRMAALFSRGRDADGVQEDLEESRADLVAAQDAGDEEAVADVQAEWRNRLRRTLRADPAAAAGLRELLDELVPVSDDRVTGPVYNYNTINGGVHNAPVIQVGQATGEPRR